MVWLLVFGFIWYLMFVSDGLYLIVLFSRLISVCDSNVGLLCMIVLLWCGMLLIEMCL